MYRVGFGDCFLLSFPSLHNTAVETMHIFVDCGVHSAGSLGNIETVVEDIAKTTEARLALIIATHAHQDHLAGFAQCAATFSRFEIEEVWLPWTEDPADEDAKALNAKQFSLAEQLQTYF